jgi:hypothetical protein
MSLFDLGAEMLNECETLLDPTVTGSSLPERRYVGHGQPPVENCNGMLCVWFGPIATRQVGRLDQAASQRIVEVAVDLWRCWPSGDMNPPSTDQLTQAALGLADDADRLTLGLSSWLIGRCMAVEWRPALPLGPQGGMAGWRLSAALSL